MKGWEKKSKNGKKDVEGSIGKKVKNGESEDEVIKKRI